jgi:hypothetical protein
MAKEGPHAPVPPSAYGLTRGQVARQLGTTTTTVHRMRLRGELHPKRGADGVYRYDPAEVIQVAATRGAPGNLSAGQVAARAFTMFDQGGELREIVQALQITPEEVFRLYALWQRSLDDPPPSREDRGARLLDEEPGADEAFARLMAQAAALADPPPPPKPKKRGPS